MQQPPQAPTPPNPNAPRQIQLELPANLAPASANAVVINQTFSEIVLDFVQIMPNDPRARVQSRVVMTPTNAKLFLQALTGHLARYEQTSGEIKVPPQPVTLADQLFGGLKPNEGDDKAAPPAPSGESS
jgi:hypothetical protein